MTTKNSKQGHIFAFEWVEIESRSEPQLMKKRLHLQRLVLNGNGFI